MTTEVEVELNRRRFLWTYEPSIASASDCFSWADASTFLTPSAQTTAELNRIFLRSIAKEVVQSMSVDDNSRHLCAAFIEMGATWEDFVALPSLLPYLSRKEDCEASAKGWPTQSPLSAMGYRVGENGLPPSKRHAILRDAFVGSLPLIGSNANNEWGEPRSYERYNKIAHFLQSMSENRSNKLGHADKAIDDWSADLRWFRQNFANQRPSFDSSGTFRIPRG